MERPNYHERLASRPPTQQDERASITALLEEIRQRRDCLSRGSVLDSNHRSGTRRISDPHGSEDRGLTLQHAAKGMLSTTTLDGAVSRPNATITAIHEDRSPHSPAPSHKIVWVRRSIKRWHPKQNTMEEIGSVEFATVAPLASVRRLIDQFYPLPHRREYEFVYPELYVRIDPSDERNVLPAAFPYIVLEALPQQPSPKHEPLVPVTTATTEHISLVQRQIVPEQPRQSRANSPPKIPAKHDANAVPIAKEPPHIVSPPPIISSAPAIYRDRWFRDVELSSVQCDLLFREFPDKNVVGVKAHLRGGGVWVGRATPYKWLSVQEVNALTSHESAQQDASPHPYRIVINKLALQLPTSSHDGGELCIVIRNQNQNVQTPVVAIEAPASVPVPAPANPARGRRHDKLPETTKSTKKADKSHQVHPSDASRDTVQQVPTQIPEPVGDSCEPLTTSANSAADSFVDEMDVCAEQAQAAPPSPALVGPIEERGDTPDGIDPSNLQFSPRESPIGIEKALKWTDLLVQDEPSDSVAKADDLMPPVPPPVYSEARDNDDPVAILDTQGDSGTYFFPPPTSFNEEAALPTPNQHAIAIVDRDDAPTIPPRGAGVGVPEVAPIELILTKVADDVSELASGSQPEIQTVDASASINVTDTFREYIPLEPTLVAPLEEETSVVAVALEEKSAEDKQPSTSPDTVHVSIPETKSDHQVQQKAEKIEVAAATEEQMVPQSKAYAVTVQDPDMSPSPEFREERLDTDSAELRLLEKYIQVVMEIFIDEFEHAEHNIASRTGMFSRDQLHKSFLHYGVNHVEFGLNGVFLAIEDDLSTFAMWFQASLNAALKTYLIKLLPQNIDDTSNLLWLFRLECALNVLTDMRSWHEPTRIRIACIEAHSSNSFLPPQAAAAAALLVSSSPASTDPKLAAFRLSDKDRELLSAVHTNDQLVSSSASLESWIADGLEILYLFLYSFLNSTRNYSGGSSVITKMMFCRTRSERLQTTIQKVITLDPTVWRKLEFLYSEIEDTAMGARLDELMASFLRNQRSHMKALESCVFFHTLVAFITRKADQIAQSVLHFVSSSVQLDSLTASRCVSSFCNQLKRSQFGSLSPLEGYLRNFGLKAIDMDKINKVRSSRKLSRMNLSGKHSLVTHHHAELMGSDFALYLRPRWNHAKLNASGSMSRYIFHGEPSIALEAVYIRRKIDVAEFHSKSWDEMQRFAEEDVREAFKFFCGGNPLKSGGTILLALGVNAFHLNSLADVSKMSTQWNTMMLENANARSLSIGYFVSNNTDIAAVRVEFRVHVDVEQLLLHPTDDPRTSSFSITDSLDTFFRTATEDALQYVLETRGFDFLFGCLDESHERQWKDIAFGTEFYQHLVARNLNEKYSRETILNCMNACMAVLPKALTAVSKRNVQIITELLVLMSGSSGAEIATVDIALRVLNEMCSAQEKPRAPSAVRKAIEPFTELQRKFAAEEGLKFLINAAEKQPVLEETILRLMKTAELAGNRAALLVHCRHWMTYFIDNGACTATRENVEFVPLLLQEIHNAFFSPDSASEPSPASTVYCACGCKGTTSIKSMNGMMKVYLRLLLCEKGVIWAQDAMQGPIDCLVFLSWTLNDSDPVVQMQQRPLQLEVFDTLRQILSRMKSADRYLHFLSALTPALLKLLATASLNITLQRAVVRILSLALEASIEKSVWKISQHSFLDSLYAILQALCSEPASSSSSHMNKVMMTTFFTSTGGMPSKPASNSTDMLRALLHQDHVESEASSYRSLLQLLLQLMNFQSGSSLQSRFQIPILVVLGSLVNNSEVAEDCVQLRLDLDLLELVEGDANVQSILASRVLCVLHFQLMVKQRTYSSNALNRLGNALTKMMTVGANMSLSRHHEHAPGTDVGTEPLHFAADGQASYSIFERFVKFNKTHLKSSKHEESLDTRAQIWWGHEWEDPDHAAGDKLAAFLNLLAVFSCLTVNILQVKDSDELKQLQELLWRFIRDREYIAEHHMVLYVFALRNIVFALRFEPETLSALSIYSELPFLKKVLFLSRKKSSKLLSELAAGLLWALASAFESTHIVSSQFAVEFDDPDKLATLSAAPIPAGSLPTIPTTNGVIMLSENILTKFASGGAIDCDIGALSSLLQSTACGEIFLRHYGYPFVIKLIDNIEGAGISGVRKASVVLTKDQQSDSRASSFGPGLVYGESLPRRDKELIQLCRLAHRCLSAMLHSKSKAIEDMIPRTKSKVLPLLDHKNVLLLHQILLCLIVHLKAHPQKCTELIESSVVDTVIALMFDPTYARLQVTAFTCLRMMLMDPKCLSKQYALGSKLFRVRQEICSSFLCNSNFETTEQALVLAVDLIFHLQDANLVIDFAAIFTESPDNQSLLADLFTRLSTQFDVNPKTGYVLQLLVRLVVQLDLTALTDTEQLVDTICLTLKVQADTTFLRPTLCHCLLRIASEGDKAESFARKSRLHTIIDLLEERLTLGEFRNIGELLIILARQHEGIRTFLCCSESGCIAKIGKVLSTFSEISSDSSAAAASAAGGGEQDSPGRDELYNQFAVSGYPIREDAAKYVVKMTTDKHVFISHYMDDIYEQASYGHVIARFLIARRILFRSTYDLKYFVGSSGIEADTLVMLSLQLLSHLAFCHRSRAEIQHGYSNDWSWVRWIMERCNPETFTPVGDAKTAKSAVSAFENASLTTMSLARFSAEKALFALARLAEYRQVVIRPLFQEKTAALLAHIPKLCADSISLANLMVLSRNFCHFTPGMQSRVADEVNLSALVGLLTADDEEIALAASDVLANALYFEELAKPVRSKTSPDGKAASLKLAQPMPSASSIVSKAAAERLQDALLPSWKRFVKDSKGEEVDNKILLEDELGIACSLLQPPILEELLRVLVDLHLRLPNMKVECAKHTGDGGGCGLADTILNKDSLPPTSERRPLQYVLPASFRNSAYPGDTSFHGSAHMWQFLRKLWRRSLHQNSANSKMSSLNERLPSLEKIVVVLSRWKSRTGISISAMTYERRAQFLAFSVSVIEVAPQLFDLPGFIEDIVGVVEDFLASPGTFGVAYEILYILCKQRPEAIERVARYFRGELTDSEENNALWINPSFHRLLTGVQLEYLLIKVSVTKLKGQETGNSATMLDPRAPSAPTLAFSIGLLNILSTQSPVLLLWFVGCQRVQLLFELLVLDRAYTSSLLPHVRYAFVSSLLEMSSRVLQLHPDLHRSFILDPRILHRVVQHVYSLKTHVQVAALQLLHELAASPKIRDMLFRIEYFSSSLCVVEDWMVNSVQERCCQLQVSPELRPKEVVELAHLIQLPFFLDLKITELVQLSMCFVGSHLVEHESLMVIAGDGRFGRIPEWMITFGSHSSRSPNLSLKKLEVLNRIDEEFQHIVAKKTADKSLMLYKIQKDAYERCTTPRTRETISNRIVQFLTRDEQCFRHSRLTHASTGLLSRVCRFLIEDRAESIRRVTFMKQHRQQAGLDEGRKSKLNDVLSLLHDCPLFDGLDRDALTCLTYCLGSPILVSLDSYKCDQDMPLMLLVGDDAEYEMRVIYPRKATLTGVLHRGSLIGFPEWLTGSLKGEAALQSQTCVNQEKLFVITLTYDDLRVGLGESHLQLLVKHYRSMTTRGDDGSHELQAFGLFTSKPSRCSLERKQLQTVGLDFLLQCMSSREFAIRFVANTWAIQIIFEVATSWLSSQLVISALEVLCRFAEDELLCKRVCAIEIQADGSGTDLDRPKWASNLSLFLGLVQRFSIVQWATNTYVLSTFFRLLDHVTQNMTVIWKNIHDIWTLEYLQQCQSVLAQGTDSKFCAAECIATHLVQAIHRQPAFLMERSRALSLHLDFTRMLALLRPSERCVGLLKLVSFYCSDPTLRGEIWASEYVFIKAFDPIFLTIAADFDALLAFAPIKSREDVRQMIQVYCSFIEVVCTADIDEELDLRFRDSVEHEFSILSLLVQLLSRFAPIRPIILRCIGVLCLDSPQNCVIAQAATVQLESRNHQKTNLVGYIMQLIEILQSTTAAIESSTEVEALLLCVQALSHSHDGAKAFIDKGFVAVALGFLRVLPNAPTARHLLVWRALVLSLRNFNEYAQREFLQSADQDTVRIFVCFFSQLSDWFRRDRDHFALGRVLRDFFRLFAVLMGDPSSREQLFILHVHDPVESRIVTEPCYHWILSGSQDDSIATVETRKSSLQTLDEELKTSSLAFITCLCLDRRMALVISSDPEILSVTQLVFQWLEACDILVDDNQARIRLRFLCYFSEQLLIATRPDATVEFIEAFSVPAILHLLSLSQVSASSLTYATRLLWAFQLISVRSLEGQPTMLQALSQSEIAGFLNFAADRIAIIAASPNAMVSVLGLIAELLMNTKVEICGDLVIRALRLLLIRLPAHDWIDGKTFARAQAIQAELSLYSAIEWDREESLSNIAEQRNFKMLHQHIRCFRYLAPGITRNLLGKNRQTACDRTFQSSILVPAIQSLSLNGASAFSRVLTLDSMGMIENILSTFAVGENGPESHHSRIQEYRRVARQNAFLLRCCPLLESPTIALRLQTIRALRKYGHKHMSIWDEVDGLRRNEKCDIIETLLNCLEYTHPENLDIRGELIMDTIRTLNTITKYSHGTHEYTRKLGYLGRLVKIRTSGRQLCNPDQQYDLAFECIRMHHLHFRICRQGQIENPAVVRDVWTLLCALLVESRNPDEHIFTTAALDCINDSDGVHCWLAKTCAREWSNSGLGLLKRLVNIASSKSIRDSNLLARKRAVFALGVFCSYDCVLDMFFADENLVQGVFVNLTLQDSLYHERLHMLTKSVKMKLSSSHLPSSIPYILSRYSSLSSIPRNERIAYLDLLPAMITESQTHCFYGHNDASIWNTIIGNVLFFLENGSQDEGIVAHAALRVVLMIDDNRSRLSDALSVLKKICTKWYRFLEDKSVKTTGPTKLVSLSRADDSQISGLSVNRTLDSDSRLTWMPTEDSTSPEVSTHINHELGLIVSNLLQLGRIVPLSSRQRDCCVQYSISLYMASAFYVDHGCNGITLDLNELLLEALRENTIRDHSKLWGPAHRFISLCNQLLRVLSVNQFNAERFVAQSTLLILLEADESARTADELFANEANIHWVIRATQFDVVDSVWRSVSTSASAFADEHECTALWCQILRYACVDLDFSKRIMESKLLYQFLWEILTGYSTSSNLPEPKSESLLGFFKWERLTDSCAPENLLNSTNESLLGLFTRILQVQQYPVELLSKDITLFRALGTHCVRTIALIPEFHPIKYDAIELLRALACHFHLLPRLRKACALYRGNVSTTDRATRISSLRGLTDMVQMCHDDSIALEHSLCVLYKICLSELGVDPVLECRRGCSISMLELLQLALKQTVGTSHYLVLRLSREALKSQQPINFLPVQFDSYPVLEACKWTLKILRLCMANKHFAESLQQEVGIFRELFAALGCSDWMVSRDAARIITEASKSFACTPSQQCHGTAEEQESNNQLSRYVCRSGLASTNLYRRLAYFATLNEHDVFDVEPRESGLASCYLILTAWVQFYANNPHLLSKTAMIADRVVTINNGERRIQWKYPSGSTCEQHLGSILDILLYLLANYFPAVYDMTGEAPIPEEKEQHFRLCSELLAFCKRHVIAEQQVVVVENDLIRCKALSLLHLMCSFDYTQYSAEIFAQELPVIRLLVIIETTKSSSEQIAAVRLVYDITSYPYVKDLFVSHHTLLLRVCSWLENPRLENLQPFAIGILKNLATKSVGQRRQNVFTFGPTFQEQLARLLFRGKQYGRKTSIAKYISPKVVHARKVDILLSFHPKKMRFNLGSESGFDFPIRVKLHVKVFRSKQEVHREFQWTSHIRSVNEHVSQSMIVDDADYAVCCKVVLRWFGRTSQISCKAKQSTTHFLNATEVQPLHSSTTNTAQTSMTMLIDSGRVIVNISDQVIDEPSEDLGPLGRLLRHEGIDLFVLEEATHIVAELSKNHRIFCDPMLKIWDHVLSALGSFASEMKQQTQSQRHDPIETVDLSCLDTLSSWFWSKPGVSFFKTSMIPVIYLIQGMRKYGFVVDMKAPESSHVQRKNARFRDKNHQNFLTALMEWVAAIEVPEFTENYLNMFFFENTDVLLFLCAHTFPVRSARASFFFLVATVVRINMVHCEVFARKHALQLLLDLVNSAKPGDELLDSTAEMLKYAARVIAKICRCSTSRAKFMSHGGMIFFGRVGFLVFRNYLSHPFLVEAAENLVLATSFLCDVIVQPPIIDPANQNDMDLLNLLMPVQVRSSASLHSSLSVIEILLRFLGHASSARKRNRSTNRGSFDSFDRLAAAVFVSLVEKHPHRVAFERTLLELLYRETCGHSGINELRDHFIPGIKKSIELTKWGFESGLNVIRRTYYAGVCAGVRTGVTPSQYRTAFLRYDQEFLIGQVPDFLDSIIKASRSQSDLNAAAHEDHDNGVDVAESDHETMLIELRKLLVFAEAHDELVTTLTANRKRHLTHAMNTSDRNGRVLVACHSVLSLAFDFFLDVLALTQTESNDGRLEWARARHHADVKSITVIQSWLRHLEELCGLVCCALHELDFNYYGGQLQQLQALMTELPSFLQKMEQVQSKKHTVLLFLKNLNKILKRIANKNELKGVAGNGGGVAEEAKKICERLRLMETAVSTALVYVLNSKVAQERLARTLVAMDYIWKRVMGSASLCEFMTGTAESTEGFWAKLKRRVTNLIAFLLNPGPFFMRQAKNLQALLASTAKNLFSSDDSSSAYDAPEDNSIEPNQAEQRDPATTTKNALVDRSYFPFCSMESLLDHFGYTSLRAKKIKQTMAIAGVRERVLKLLSGIFEMPPDTIEKLSVIQLEAQLQKLDSDQIKAVFYRLQKHLDKVEAGIQLRLVEKIPFELRLWPLLIRPIQRIRLFHLYFLVRDFLASDSKKQEDILSKYRLEDEEEAYRKSLLVEGTIQASDENYHPEEVKTHHKTSKSFIQKAKTRGRRQTLLSNLSSERLKLKIAATLESANTTSMSSYRLQASSPDELFNAQTLATCDKISCVDPFTEELAVERLRQTLDSRKELTGTPGFSYAFSSATPQFIRRLGKQAQLIFLVLMFWRQDELAADLNNNVLLKAFHSRHERDEYFLSFHTRKACAELVRVWMPESGNLGLRLWQMPVYLLGGTLVSIVIAFIFPLVHVDDERQRNTFMMRIVYGHVALVFVLSTASIVSIARKHFVLQERDRIRFSPAAKYYDNVFAVISIIVELVQLNSLSFDPTIEWNKSDQIPKLMQWLGSLGITQIGIAQIELKAALYILALVVWFLMLKSANKFQESSPKLNHLFTKDLPLLLNGFLYMSTITTFFSFLSCIDCKGKYGELFDKCINSDMADPPFLLSHQSITCWSQEHQKYAFLGIWGITFFLPVGLLSHGMNQVLFQQEKLDIKYAAVIVLFSQLVKALTATAKAFFTFNSLVLACIGLAGNGVLLLLMSCMKSSSLWFIKLIKSGIYAASCWSSMCAIYQIRKGAMSSMSLIYIGWLTIAAVTMSAVLLVLRRQADRKQKEDQGHWAMHQALMASTSASEVAVSFTDAEQKFLDISKKRAATPSSQAAIFVNKAHQLNVDNPPAELEHFMRQARAMANSKSFENNQNAALGVAFMKNARILAKKVDSSEGLRLRKHPNT